VVLGLCPPSKVSLGNPSMHYTDLDRRLAVGAAPCSAEDLTALKSDASITAVVCLQSKAEVEEAALARLCAHCRQLGISHTHVPIGNLDSDDDIVQLDAAVVAVRALAQTGQKVYVHCSVGVTRSPSVVVAFLVAHRGLSIEQAIAWLMVRTRDINPRQEVIRSWAVRKGHLSKRIQ